MNRLEEVKLILFFTKDVSLRTWDQVGMLEREVAIYRRLLPHLGSIAFLTYGDRSDLSYAPRLGGIEILCNRWGLPKKIYTRMAPLLYWRKMWQASIYKTNQTEGAEVAILAKRLFGKKLITRCGFMWSLYLSQHHWDGVPPQNSAVALRRERHAFIRADLVMVTTPLMKQHAVDHYNLSSYKVQVIPNYVLTDVFTPSVKRRSFGQRIIFVGRLVDQKNPLGLLEAVRGLNIQLTMIGDGPLRPQLEDLAVRHGIDVRFLGNRPHYGLPGFFNETDLFVLPSRWEGHPKALLEAMACGLPTVVVNAQGTQELIEHRKTGFLCGPSPNEIRSAIQEVMSDEHLRASMGEEARAFVISNFSIDNVMKLELNLLNSLTSDE